MADAQETRLAPPGAGLPLGELLLARTLFALRRWTSSRRSFEVRFDRERKLVRALFQQCDAETGARRVLISRIPGLEDSSRNWSVWMTLEHLRIVHELLASIIADLVREVTPPGETGIAAVKPNADVGPEVVEAYEASSDLLVSVIASSPNLNTRARYPHPWFGPLNAADWHALAGSHLGIHRTQIERILKGLRS
ncbi:MAG: DinB family protein [Planctomycetota bacterium]